MSAVVRPSAPPEPASAPGLARAKLRPWERPHDAEDPADPFATAACFDDAIHELRHKEELVEGGDPAKWSNVAIARHLGVNEVVVREMREGLRTLTAPRIQRLPPELAVRVLRKLLHLFAEE